MVNNQCFISMTRAKRKPSTMGRFKAACTFAAELIPTGLLTGCAIFDFFGRSIPTPDKLMSLRKKPAVAIYFCVLFGAQAAPALAQDPCAGFKWDVSRERALFGSSAQEQPAGKDAATAPALVPNQLYRLRLLPRGQVAFAVPPGKETLAADTYAGLAALQIPASGRYRISIDLPIWIDVAANGKLVPASDYEAEHGCDAPRKIVVFDLDDKRRLMLQLSAASQAVARLTVTRVLVE